MFLIPLPKIPPQSEPHFWDIFWSFRHLPGEVCLPTPVFPSPSGGKIVLVPSIHRDGLKVRGQVVLILKESEGDIEISAFGDWFDLDGKTSVVRVLQWALLESHSRLRGEALGRGIQIDWIAEESSDV